MKKKTKFKIQSERERENVLIAFANNGYRVHVEVVENEDYFTSKTYYVVVE